MKKRHLLVYYAKHRWKLFVLFIAFHLSFFIIFLLNHLPLDAIGYGFLLWFYICAVVFVFDFVRFVRHLNRLESLKKSITVDVDGLPFPQNIFEEKYQELIKILFKQQKVMALKAENKEIDLIDYFTQWTHQIKTPIAAMRLLLQAGNNEQKRDLEMELYKIEKNVEFILQYVRFDQMANDLVIKRHSLDDILKKAIRKNAKIFIYKNIPLNYEETGATVLTDAKWLQFVIEQILSNALKYTKKGSISIYMESPVEKKHLVIEDTGIGIREEDLPRVFEKGFTGYNGRIDSQSSGIGLYLCKKILDQLSHRISIHSTVGKGTKVILDLKTEEMLME